MSFKFIEKSFKFFEVKNIDYFLLQYNNYLFKLFVHVYYYLLENSLFNLVASLEVV